MGSRRSRKNKQIADFLAVLDYCCGSGAIPTDRDKFDPEPEDEEELRQFEELQKRRKIYIP